MNFAPTVAQRVIAATTSVVLLGAGVIALSHHVEERHEVCAEHGELVHVSAGDKAAAHDTHDAQGHAIDANRQELDHGDHCAIAWSAPETPTSDSAIAGEASPAITVVAATPEGRRSSAQTLYRLSPKNSPPA